MELQSTEDILYEAIDKVKLYNKYSCMAMRLVEEYRETGELSDMYITEWDAKVIKGCTEVNGFNRIPVDTFLYNYSEAVEEMGYWIRQLEEDIADLDTWENAGY